MNKEIAGLIDRYFEVNEVTGLMIEPPEHSYPCMLREVCIFTNATMVKLYMGDLSCFEVKGKNDIFGDFLSGAGWFRMDDLKETNLFKNHIQPVMIMNELK